VMAMLSPDLVRLLYGNAWSETAWVLAVMFLCLPAWACWGLSTPVLWNTNRKQYEFLLQLPLVAIAAPAWWFVAPGGVEGIAIVSACVIYARAIVIITAALRALGLRWRVVLPYLARGVALAALCAAAVLAGQEVATASQSSLVALCAGAVAAGAAMLSVLWLRPAALGDETRMALSRVVPFFGARLAPTVAPVDQGGSTA